MDMYSQEELGRGNLACIRNHFIAWDAKELL